MKKYVSPYMAYPKPDDEAMVRLILCDPNHRDSFYGVFLEDCDKDSIPKWYHSNLPGWEKFDTKEQAMADLDRRLIEKGYTLLTEEQYEKLKVLL